MNLAYQLLTIALTLATVLVGALKTAVATSNAAVMDAALQAVWNLSLDDGNSSKLGAVGGCEGESLT